MRTGKVLVDWSQNDNHKSTVAPYSLRAQQQPTVSTPVTWKEIEDCVAKKSGKGLYFEAGDLDRRMKKYGDLFKPVYTLRQQIPKFKTDRSLVAV